MLRILPRPHQRPDGSIEPGVCRTLHKLWLLGGMIVAAETLSAAMSATAQDSSVGSPLLSMDQAIWLAIANNRSLQVASLDIDKSNWQVAEFKTKRLPSLSTTVLGSQLLNELSFTFKEGAFGNFPATGPIPSTDTKITTPRQPTAYVVGQVTQPLSQLYKIHLGLRAQQLSSQLTSEKQRAERQSLIKDVKQAYYGVLQSESALEAEEANVKQYQELDRVVLQRVSQEAALKSDSLDVKAKLAHEQYTLDQLRNTLHTRKEYLNDLLGRDIRTDFRTGVAQVAMQQGHYAGRAIERRVSGKPAPRPFRYFDKGTMALVGPGYAVLQTGKLRVKGLPAFLVWATVHIMFLAQRGLRISVFLQWIWTYFTNQRGARLIVNHHGPAAEKPTAETQLGASVSGKNASVA